LKAYLKEAMPTSTDAKILVPGCGDSLLSEKLVIHMGFT
jgi:ubiquinone/menaquinone biosynthesis C-methylase UbiE